MIKLKPSIVFLDLDGTTYDIYQNKTHDISKENKRAIKELNKKVPVVISTGRSPEFVLGIQKELGLKYSVVQNGAMIFDDKEKKVFQDYIPNKNALEILNFAQNNNSGTKVNDEKIFYGMPRIFNKIISSWGFQSTHKKSKIDPKKTYTKIIVIGKRKRKTKKLKKQLEEKYKNINIVTSFNGFSIEITGQKSSKGIANKWVAEQLKVDYKKGVHFGDSMNDSTTSQYMRLVAMKNASKKLKKMATITTSFNNKNAGISKAFKECLKI
ncbi:MAG: Cof-type HAD-IIB family hydrolase [Mycoplasma sp.]|nr:Cof-type HAD-IIB family hydrolase [Mycoplasma sp.]